MVRGLVFICLLTATLVVDASPLCAQDADRWPDWLGSPPSQNLEQRFDPPYFLRGPGGYFSVVKLGLTLLVFWGWMAAGDWISRDAVTLKRDYRRWNAIVFFPFFAAFLLMLLLPYFIVTFPLLILALVGPAAAYVIARNKALHAAEKVFTAEHIRYVLLSKLTVFGMKAPKSGGKKEKAAPVLLTPRGTANQAEEQVRLIAARQQNGFNSAGHLVHRAMQRRAAAIMLDFTPEAAAVRFQIDGVWLDVETQPRQYADPLLASLKALAGLKPEERRVRQQGQFMAVDEAAKLKLPTKLTSQGTKTGERAIVQFEDPQLRKRRLPDVGIRQKLQDDLVALFKETKGLIVLAAPPGGGLTTLTTVCLTAVDRYTRTVMAIEDMRSKDIEVENVPVTTFDGLEQETAATKLPGVIRHFPDVIVVPDVTDSETLKILCGEAREERVVVTTLRAKDASEALVRPLLTKISPKTYAMAVKAAVAHKLVRKLCEKCREAYPPPPQILQRLGITADKVPAFYRPPTARPDQKQSEPCLECGGIGYKGQTGLIELLTVTDPLRQQLVQDPSVDAVRAAARKAGLKTFEDEGLLLVVKGVTSVAELARVLKEPAPAAAAAT